MSSNKAIVYKFFARHMRKVYSDSDIKTDLKNNEGLSFFDRITPSDIAFVISVLKNGREMWDQNIKVKQWVWQCMEIGRRTCDRFLLEGKERKRSKVRVCGVVRD